MANATPEQMKGGMDAWMAWRLGKAGERGCRPRDAPRAHHARGCNRRERGGRCGYSILQAASAQDVTNLRHGHTHLEMSGASIDVLESLDARRLG